MQVMDESPALHEAIERLYKAFSKYPLPADTNPCPCCHARDADARLRAKRLHELAWKDMGEYADQALLSWGDVAVFKHFLPRIIELTAIAADEAWIQTDPEVIFSKFHHGEWRSWPKEEQDAIEVFLRVMWKDVLASPPVEGDLPDIETWLCSIGQCEDDLSPYLDEWVADGRLSASLALSYLLLDTVLARADDAGRNAFWDKRDAQYAQLKVWATSPAVVWKLRLAEIRWRRDGHAKHFARARAIIS
jgi:hypothetical protein